MPKYVLFIIFIKIFENKVDLNPYLIFSVVGLSVSSFQIKLINVNRKKIFD